jgi:Gas vesicle synthesis protein GvpL/GvpF
VKGETSRVSTYLYCVRGSHDGRPEGVLGLDGAPVRSIDAATLMAWVSDVTTQPVDVTVDRLRAHDGVCAAALASGDTPLPIRFGQSFVDDAALVRGIVDREATLRERLERVAGCVELRVVVTRGRDADVNERTLEPEDPSVVEGPGTSFLRRLARVGRADLAREVTCEDVRHMVRAAARAFIIEQQPCEATRGMAYFPVLVRRSAVPAFRAATADILSSQQIGLSVLGPFAPYSFATDG